mgnify:CR=1 FL=1
MRVGCVRIQSKQISVGFRDAGGQRPGPAGGAVPGAHGEAGAPLESYVLCLLAEDLPQDEMNALIERIQMVARDAAVAKHRAEELAHIATETAALARRMGHEPRVAFLSFSTFGNPMGKWLEPIRDAVAILDEQNVNFEYEGEMAPDAALNPKVMANYPFSRLSGPANVLIMPGLQSANISAKLLRELAGNAIIGPMLVGMEKPVQIAPMTAIAPDILTLAVLAAGGIAG